MIKKLSLALVCTALSVGTASAGSIGVAESEDRYRVNRDGEVINPSLDLPSIVQTGDILRAGDDIVRMRTMTGETVVLDQNSQVLFDENNYVEVLSGKAIAAVPAGSTLTLGHGGMRLVPLSIEADQQGQVVLMVEESGAVRAGASNGTFRILDAEGDQIGMLADGDAMTLVKDADGKWAPETPVLQQQVDDPVLADQVQPPPTDDDERRDEVAALWLIGGGAAVVAGGSYLGYRIYRNNRSSTTRRDPPRRRPGLSPIFDEDGNIIGFVPSRGTRGPTGGTLGPTGGTEIDEPPVEEEDEGEDDFPRFAS